MDVEPSFLFLCVCVVSLTISLLIEKVTSFTLGCRKNPPRWTCMHNRANKFKISFRPSSESWFSDFGPFFYFHIIGKISHCHLLSTKAFSLYEVFCVISLLQVLPAVLNVMKEEATLVTLIKPQFEAHRSQVCNLISAEFALDFYMMIIWEGSTGQKWHELTSASFFLQVGRGGIVKDPSVHKEVFFFCLVDYVFIPFVLTEILLHFDNTGDW